MKANDNIPKDEMLLAEAIAAAWAKLPLVGEQPEDDGVKLELRNCKCGSTLAREVRL